MFSDVNSARQYLAQTSAGGSATAASIGRLNPTFAVNLANAIQTARAQGINAGAFSAFRTPGWSGVPKTQSQRFDATGASLHSYGLAVDVAGIGGAGTDTAKAWYKIATDAGLYNPYGYNNKAEFNHFQAIPDKSAPMALRSTINADGSPKLGPDGTPLMWSVAGLKPPSGGPVPPADIPNPNSVTLRKGMSGPAVMALQQQLAAAGVSVGKIDGVYGPKTERAVHSFEIAQGLPTKDRGVAGPEVLGALARVSDPAQSAASVARIMQTQDLLHPAVPDTAAADTAARPNNPALRISATPLPGYSVQGPNAPPPLSPTSVGMTASGAAFGGGAPTGGSYKFGPNPASTASERVATMLASLGNAHAAEREYDPNVLHAAVSNRNNPLAEAPSSVAASDGGYTGSGSGGRSLATDRAGISELALGGAMTPDWAMKATPPSDNSSAGAFLRTLGLPNADRPNPKFDPPLSRFTEEALPGRVDAPVPDALVAAMGRREQQPIALTGSAAVGAGLTSSAAPASFEPNIPGKTGFDGLFNAVRNIPNAYANLFGFGTDPSASPAAASMPPRSPSYTPPAVIPGNQGPELFGSPAPYVPQTQGGGLSSSDMLSHQALLSELPGGMSWGAPTMVASAGNAWAPGPSVMPRYSPPSDGYGSGTNVLPESFPQSLKTDFGGGGFFSSSAAASPAPAYTPPSASAPAAEPSIAGEGPAIETPADLKSNFDPLASFNSSWDSGATAAPLMQSAAYTKNFADIGNGIASLPQSAPAKPSFMQRALPVAASVAASLVPGLNIVAGPIARAMTRGPTGVGTPYQGPLTSSGYYAKAGMTPWGSQNYSAPGSLYSNSPFTPGEPGWNAPSFTQGSGGPTYAYNYNPQTGQGSFINSYGNSVPYSTDPSSPNW